jgi:predicted ArsR family transcriptional regulator
MTSHRGRSLQPMDPKEERRIVYILRNSDELSIDDIAKRVGRHPDKIRRIARKHGISRKKSA